MTGPLAGALAARKIPTQPDRLSAEAEGFVESVEGKPLVTRIKVTRKAARRRSPPATGHARGLIQDRLAPAKPALERRDETPSSRARQCSVGPIRRDRMRSRDDELVAPRHPRCHRRPDRLGQVLVTPEPREHHT